MLRELAPDLWIEDQPLRFFGVELGARMTVVGLRGGRLLLHSPIACSRELAEQVERLGSPSFLVAPNRLHHLYIHEWQAAFPACRTYVAPGVDAKRPDLQVSGILGETPLPDWSETLDQALVAGFPFANEVVFFHEPSRTLVASDLLFNVGDGSPLLTRLAFRLTGAYGRPSSTLLERFLVRTGTPSGARWNGSWRGRSRGSSSPMVRWSKRAAGRPSQKPMDGSSAAGESAPPDEGLPRGRPVARRRGPVVVRTIAV